MTVRVENGRLVADTAAELDRYIQAEQCYREAKAEGLSDEDALGRARAKAEEVRQAQFLRSVGMREPQ